ncbi:MAG: hypothetical protein V4550_03780 [Gemmatimonadota bacterium]
MGHLAIAISLKSGEPRAALVPLVIAAFGPDWVEAALMMPHTREGMAPYTHSIPAVMLGAVIASGAYALIARRPGAKQVAAAWLLHWLADLLSGRKPVIGLNPLIGLDLYHVPPAEFLLECVVIATACYLYARAFATTRAKRQAVVILAVVMAILQLGLNASMSKLDGTPWNPSLALAP